jgi:hypothetical protein
VADHVRLALYHDVGANAPGFAESGYETIDYPALANSAPWEPTFVDIDATNEGAIQLNDDVITFPDRTAQSGRAPLRSL